MYFGNGGDLRNGRECRHSLGYDRNRYVRATQRTCNCRNSYEASRDVVMIASIGQNSNSKKIDCEDRWFHDKEVEVNLKPGVRNLKWEKRPLSAYIYTKLMENDWFLEDPLTSIFSCRLHVQIWTKEAILRQQNILLNPGQYFIAVSNITPQVSSPVSLLHNSFAGG